MSSDKVLETSVDIRWLQKILIDASTSGKSPPNPPSLLSWTAEKIGIGMGYLSHIIKVEFSWSHHMDGLPKSVVLKVPTMESLDKAISEMAPDLGENVIPKNFVTEVS